MPVSSNGGTQGTIVPSQNGGSAGNQPSQCHTDWGYNRCTDHLTIVGVDNFDLSILCNLQSINFDSSFNLYERGMFTITSLTQTGSSLSIGYIIFCGEGTYFEGASHFVDYDYDYGKEGYSLMDFIYDMAEAMGDAHEPAVIDGLAEWREEEMLKKIAAKKALEEWRAAHSEQDVDPDADDDTDTDDDNDNSDADDENTPSLHDGDGCPDDEWVLC